MLYWFVLQGNSNVIGISIDHYEEIKSLTSERAFERFSNLQFLRIAGKGINPLSMNYIFQKLKVLNWMDFPMSCFPSSFNPEFLVELDMPSSQLEKLWEGIKVSNILALKITAQVRLPNQFSYVYNTNCVNVFFLCASFICHYSRSAISSI